MRRSVRCSRPSTPRSARGDSASQARADLDEKLRGHLTHEEEAAVPLINDASTEEQWIAFGKTSAEQIGPDMPRFLPWVLDGADDDRTAAVLAVMPEPVQQAYRTEWLPAYRAVDHWAATGSVE